MFNTCTVGPLCLVSLAQVSGSEAGQEEEDDEEDDEEEEGEMEVSGQGPLLEEVRTVHCMRGCGGRWKDLVLV